MVLLSITATVSLSRFTGLASVPRDKLFLDKPDGRDIGRNGIVPYEMMKARLPSIIGLFVRILRGVAYIA